MLRAKLVVLSENIIIDQSTNNLSLIDVLEGIEAPSFPLVLPRLHVLFLLERDPGDSELVKGVVVISSDGEKAQEFPVEISFQEKRRVRQVIVFNGYLVRQPGPLKAALVVDGQELGSYEIIIDAIPAPQVETK